jgi:hypothetical protein
LFVFSSSLEHGLALPEDPRLVEAVLGLLRTELGAVEQRLGAKIGAVEQRLGAKIGAVEQRLGAQIVEVRSELGEVRSELGEVRSELGDVRSELGDVRSELGEVRSEIGEVRSEIGATERRLLRAMNDTHYRAHTSVEALSVSCADTPVFLKKHYGSSPSLKGTCRCSSFDLCQCGHFAIMVVPARLVPTTSLQFVVQSAVVVDSGCLQPQLLPVSLVLYCCRWMVCRALAGPSLPTNKGPTNKATSSALTGLRFLWLPTPTQASQRTPSTPALVRGRFVSPLLS